jgi:hypothetical protein
MAFSKLDPKITSSSLWDQKDHVVRVWVAFLAEKDENGLVISSYGSMRRTCNVTDDQDGIKFDEAIKILESPDPDSRTPDFDGRRIEKINGGWIVLNHEKYRLNDCIIREQTKERVRRFRDKNKQCNVTDTLPSVSVSEYGSVSGYGKEGIQKGEGKKYTCRRRKETVPAELYGVNVLLAAGEYKKMIDDWGNKFTDEAILDYDTRYPNSAAIRKHTDHNLGIRDYVKRGFICQGKKPFVLEKAKGMQEWQLNLREAEKQIALEKEEEQQQINKAAMVRRDGTGMQGIGNILSEIVPQEAT